MIEVHDYTVEIVPPTRAMRAAGIPIRTEHEVIDDQLIAAVEQLRQGLRSLRPLEYISLVYAALSTRSQGSSRRSWLNRSRRRVNSFSLIRNCLRASIHSSCATILCSAIVTSCILTAAREPQAHLLSFQSFPKCEPKKANVEIRGRGHSERPIERMNPVANPEGAAGDNKDDHRGCNDPHLT